MIKFLCLGCVLFSSMASVAPWKAYTRKVWQTAFNACGAACMLLCWLQASELLWFFPLLFWALMSLLAAFGSQEKSLWYLQAGLLLGVIGVWTWDWLFAPAPGIVAHTQAISWIKGWAQP